MRSWNNGNNWDFARWLRNVSRNAKANIGSGNGLPSEEVANYRQLIAFFCSISEDSSSSSSGLVEAKPSYHVSGTRPWLASRLVDKSVSSGGRYVFNSDAEPAYAIVRQLEVIARDLVAIPLSSDEVAYLRNFDFMPVDKTTHAQGDSEHRALGARTGFGGVAGSRNGVVFSGVQNIVDDNSSLSSASNLEELANMAGISTDDSTTIEGIVNDIYG